MLIGKRKGRTTYSFTLYNGVGYEDHVFSAPLEPEQIEKILGLVVNSHGDPEVAHLLMDGLLIALANDAGHQNVIEAFYDTPKWYA